MCFISFDTLVVIYYSFFFRKENITDVPKVCSVSPGLMGEQWLSQEAWNLLIDARVPSKETIAVASRMSTAGSES